VLTTPVALASSFGLAGVTVAELTVAGYVFDIPAEPSAA
jgi:hypothetical protein